MVREQAEVKSRIEKRHKNTNITRQVQGEKAKSTKTQAETEKSQKTEKKRPVAHRTQKH